MLPAAIFILPGIADSLVDDAIVYAYAGGKTIGPEITHGFDDQGCQFDERGNLQNSWTPVDAHERGMRAWRRTIGPSTGASYALSGKIVRFVQSPPFRAASSPESTDDMAACYEFSSVWYDD